MRFIIGTAVFLGWLALFYGVPTAVEWVLVPHVGYWVGVVALGDLAGCVFLFALGLRRLAVLLFAGLATVEAAVLGFHLMPPQMMLWFSDFVPALIIAFFLTASADLLGAASK